MCYPKKLCAPIQNTVSTHYMYGAAKVRSACHTSPGYKSVREYHIDLPGKMRKDRLVYMSSDMSELISDYLEFLFRQIGNEPLWLFPSVDPAKHMSGGCAQRFRDFWNMTPSALNCEKAPTIHSLRHTYVVMRMNQWMESGYDLRVMMPYLSRQLGHVSVDETFYYYHQVIDAHRIIRQKDSLASLVLPEVRVK